MAKIAEPLLEECRRYARGEITIQEMSDEALVASAELRGMAAAYAERHTAPQTYALIGLQVCGTCGQALTPLESSHPPRLTPIPHSCGRCGRTYLLTVWLVTS